MLFILTILLMSVELIIVTYLTTGELIKSNFIACNITCCMSVKCNGFTYLQICNELMHFVSST